MFIVYGMMSGAMLSNFGVEVSGVSWGFWLSGSTMEVLIVLMVWTSGKVVCSSSVLGASSASAIGRVSSDSGAGTFSSGAGGGVSIAGAGGGGGATYVKNPPSTPHYIHLF